MLQVSKSCERRGYGAPIEADAFENLVPYIKEILVMAPEVVVDFVMEDLETYEATGFASSTLRRLFERAQCLADADRISVNFAA